MIDCTDEQLIEEVRRRGFVIRDAQISRKWIGLTEDEVALIWNDMGARPKINGYDFAKVLEEKLKERNDMNNEEWQEKYTKMSIFYQDRLKYTEDMLVKAMEMNLKLVGMLQDSRADYKFGPGLSLVHGPGFSDPLKHKHLWDSACVVCGLKGVNGYVCQNTACPSRVTCNGSTSI